jgi:hypothetical protein
MKDFEHLIRLAGLFAIGITSFIVIRAALIPEGFGELGHYRSGAIEDNRDQPLIFSGRGACFECHDEKTANDNDAGHAGVGCEACHGAQAAHAADPEGLMPTLPEPTALCSNCHELNVARPSWFPQVDVEDHAGEDACLDCHDAHQPVME